MDGTVTSTVGECNAMHLHMYYQTPRHETLFISFSFVSTPTLASLTLRGSWGELGAGDFAMRDGLVGSTGTRPAAPCSPPWLWRAWVPALVDPTRRLSRGPAGELGFEVRVVTCRQLPAWTGGGGFFGFYLSVVAVSEGEKTRR